MSSRNCVHSSYRERQTEIQTWLNSQSARQTLSLSAVSTSSAILLKFAPELITDHFANDKIQAQKNWIHFPRVIHGLLSGGPEANTSFSYSTLYVACNQEIWKLPYSFPVAHCLPFVLPQRAVPSKSHLILRIVEKAVPPHRSCRPICSMRSVRHSTLNFFWGSKCAKPLDHALHPCFTILMQGWNLAHDPISHHFDELNSFSSSLN